MSYNMDLANRIRVELNRLPDIEEKKMFGGVGFLIHGNMACGVHKNDLIVRVGAEQNVQALARPYARPFDITGKPMAGWILVGSGGYESETDLKDWIKLGVEFASSLPPK